MILGAPAAALAAVDVGGFFLSSGAAAAAVTVGVVVTGGGVAATATSFPNICSFNGVNIFVQLGSTSKTFNFFNVYGWHLWGINNVLYNGP